jgi:tetratricopeptide (TPR) repeat protein
LIGWRRQERSQIGAALGRSFSHELISAVAGVPQRQVDDALTQLVSAELIFRRGTPPDAEYTFKHALVQDAAYGTLLRSRRQQLHARIASTLESQFPEIVETQPQLVAQHCAEAGLTQRAVAYWLEAGEHAISRWAMMEAVAQLRKGIDLLSRMPVDAASQEQELNLQIALGNALIATNGYGAPEPGEAFTRARELCAQLNKPQQLGVVLFCQFIFRLVRGEFDLAEYHAEEMHHLGETQNDLTWKFFGWYASGNILCWLGQFEDARTHCDNALSLWHPEYRAIAVTPDDAYVVCLMLLSRTLLCLGYVDQARLRREQALAEARRLSHLTLVSALSQAWLLDWAIEGVKAAQKMLRSADGVLAISNEQGFPVWLGIGRMLRGWSLCAAGQAPEGIPLLLEGVPMYRATGASLGMPFFVTILAEAYGLASQSEEAFNRLTEAAKFVESTQERWVEAEIHRLSGTLLLSMSNHEAAQGSYQRALTVARRQSAKFWELRAALDLARLWRDQGKRNEARDLLAPIYGWFTEGFDTPARRQGAARPVGLMAAPPGRYFQIRADADRRRGRVR